MQKVFRIIKRKRNLRRLSALWLCLVMLELFCPVFCDEPAFAAKVNSPRTEAAASINNSQEKSSETSISGCNHQGSDNHEGTVCMDECLCHGVAITGLGPSNFKESFNKGERIAFKYGEPVFNSLPPPFQPPKNS